MWQIEPKWTWTDTILALSTCSDLCGDGSVVQQQLNYCDDGQTTPGDGWDTNCAVEDGWECTLGDSTTQSICTDLWGDGIVVTSSIGFCDDNNITPGDGCDSNCAVEDGWECTLGDTTTSVCTEVWGDGRIMSSYSSAILWDDGNNIDGDGCSSTCIVESGWTWSGGDTTASKCIDKWGDGVVIQSDTVEGYCDDGNTNNGDGCSSSWLIETNFACSLANSTTASICNEWTDKSCLEYEKASACICKRRQKSEVVVSPETETLSNVSQIISGTTAVVTIVACLFISSSPATIWVMANQLQLFSLLLLTKSELPDDVIGFITSSNYMSFNMDFLSMTKIRK